MDQHTALHADASPSAVPQPHPPLVPAAPSSAYVPLSYADLKPGPDAQRDWPFPRYAATPPNWVIEWTADGKDYLGLGPDAEPDFARCWPVLQSILANAEKPLGRGTLLRAWPDTAPAPAKQTLWKWLNQLVRDGQVLQNGRGIRKDPYLYSLPGMLEKWQANVITELNRMLEQNAFCKTPPRHGGTL